MGLGGLGGLGGVGGVGGLGGFRGLIGFREFRGFRGFRFRLSSSASCSAHCRSNSSSNCCLHAPHKFKEKLEHGNQIVYATCLSS